MCLDRSESWKRERSRCASSLIHVCCSMAVTFLILQRCFAKAQLWLCHSGILGKTWPCRPRVRL